MKHIKLFENFRLNESVDVEKLREVESSPKKLGTIPQKKYNKEEEAFIKHMEAEMSWNGASLWKSVNNMFFSYSCYPGSSVIKDLKEAAKKFGVKVSVEKISNDWYEITVLPSNAKETKTVSGPDDFSEAIAKMDKWMPDFDEDVEKDFNKAAKSVSALATYFENNADEEKMMSYVNAGEKGIDWKELAKQYLKK